jgi:hypothetical protein
MHTNFGGNTGVAEPPPKEREDTMTKKIDESSSKLRKYSNTVKDILTETKQALSLGLNNEEEQNNMTINEEVTVVELAPSVFQAIRRLDNITPQMIEQSLDTDKN